MTAGRYDEAIEWADRALLAQPRYMPAMRIKLVSLADLGRTDDTREWFKRLLDLNPGLTVAAETASYATGSVYSPELLARYVDSLRKAGAPGVPQPAALPRSSSRMCRGRPQPNQFGRRRRMTKRGT
jgi:tetratricopeptide (TPR) repeat protein